MKCFRTIARNFLPTFVFTRAFNGVLNGWVEPDDFSISYFPLSSAGRKLHFWTVTAIPEGGFILTLGLVELFRITEEVVEPSVDHIKELIDTFVNKRPLYKR